MWHPWRELRAIDGLIFGLRDDLPSGNSWWVPEENVILMRTGLLQVERRCALAHELGHRELELPGCVPYADAARQQRRDELNVDGWAARMLIEFDALIDVGRWASCRDEAAEELWVTRHLLEVRLARLAPYERAVLKREGFEL